jgi:predicted RecA/RadA family phage recombinase
MKQFRKVSDGKSITITSPNSYKKGDFVYINGLYGIAENTVEVGEKLVLLIERNIIVNLNVATHFYYPAEVGALVFYNTDTNTLTTQRENSYLIIGRIVEADKNNVDLFLFSDNVDPNKLNLVKENITFSYIGSGNKIIKIDDTGNIYTTFEMEMEVGKLLVFEDYFLVSGYSELYKVDLQGNVIWEYIGHTSGINDINYINTENYLHYLTVSADDTLRIIDEDGMEIRQYTEDEGQRFWSVEKYKISDFQIYVWAGSRGKITSFITDGVVMFETNTSIISSVYPYDIAIDQNSNKLYIAAGTNLLCYNFNGDTGALTTSDWEYTGHTKNINAVEVDNSGNIYTSSNDGTTKKIDSNGNMVWSYSLDGSYAENVKVDNLDNVYIGTSYSGNQDMKLIKIDQNQNLIFEYQSENYVESIDLFDGMKRRLE